MAELEESGTRLQFEIEERCAQEYNVAVHASKCAIDAAEAHLEEKEKQVTAGMTPPLATCRCTHSG